MKLRSFLFPKNRIGSGWASFGIFVVRVGFAAMLITHGWAKLRNFDQLAAGGFPDPIGLGSAVAVSLAIFAELVCSAAVLLGFLQRIALIPMIVTMAVAFVVIHNCSISEGETALLYLIVFVTLYITGPGRISLDHLLS